MKLIIDLSSQNPCLILKKDKKEIEKKYWKGLYFLSETLINQIDKLLKENRIKLAEVEKIQVIPSKKSIVSTRIAKVVALGLKI